MKVQIIYCHPSDKSYTHEILTLLNSELKEQGFDVDISDLYAMDFQSELSAEEYEREGLLRLELPIPKDVQKEQRKIEAADCIIFLYPVWWSDCPAKLKGWFDRVYSVGYAYGQNKGQKLEKMKKIKYGLVLCTAGHPTEYLNEIGIAESMRNIMVDDRLGMRFKHKEMIILGGTLDIDKVRLTHSQVVNSIGDKIRMYCN